MVKPGRPIFYLCPFLVAATNITQYLTINGKSVDGVLWIGTLDRRMTGADKCTELWKMCLTEASRFGKWFCSICLSFELKSTIESNPAFHQNFCIRQYMGPEKHNNNNPLWKMDERYQDRERERIIFFYFTTIFSQNWSMEKWLKKGFRFSMFCLQITSPGKIFKEFELWNAFEFDNFTEVRSKLANHTHR